MCTTNSDCQAGFRCETSSGQCVASNSSGDPIKPKPLTPAPRTSTVVEEKEEEE